MKRYLHILLSYRIAILVCFFIITAFLGFFAKGMKTDNSIEIWLSEDDKDLAYYNEFLKNSGTKSFWWLHSVRSIFLAGNICSRSVRLPER